MQIAKSNNLGFSPYPPMEGVISSPIIYSFFYLMLTRKISKIKATVLVLIAPTLFYLLLLFINSFAAWDFIYLMNELINYPLCILKYVIEAKGIGKAETNEMIFYVLLPILYQLIVISLAKLLQRTIQNKIRF
ncbi:MAG: hypothetical protein ABL929_13150 [Ferruginibacter sp.]